MALEPHFSDPTRCRNNQPTFNDTKIKKTVSAKARANKIRARIEARKRLENPIVPWEESIELAAKAFVKFDFDKAAWFIDNKWLGRDLRGVDNPRQSSIWAKVSHVTCALKAIGGYPAVRVRRLPQRTVAQTVITKLLETHKETLEHYDIFFAWRCGCSHNLEVVYETIDDLPTEPGYHDACPRCGQAPIEILRAAKKAKQLGLRLPT